MGFRTTKRCPPRRTSRGRTEQSGLGAAPLLAREAAGKEQEREQIAVRKEAAVGEPWRLVGGPRIRPGGSPRKMEQSASLNGGAVHATRKGAYSLRAPLFFSHCNERPLQFPCVRFGVIAD